MQKLQQGKTLSKQPEIGSQQLGCYMKGRSDMYLQVSKKGLLNMPCIINIGFLE